MEDRVISVSHVRDRVDVFLTATAEARALSIKCREYFDNKQWTAEERQKLTKRKQAPIVVNRIKPKVKGLLGLYRKMQSDPKAYPRTKKHDRSAEVVTDGLRFVAENSHFERHRMAVAENYFIEGYGGVSVDVRQKPDGEIEIQPVVIPHDRIYFDPHSREKDFSDSRYFGIIMWMSEDEAKEKLPGADFDGLYDNNEYSDGTFEDRPQWADAKSKRIRVALHYEIVDGKWTMCMFCGDRFLVEPQPSPYLDEDGEPCCPIELVAAYVDGDNNRYSEVAGFLDQQDEINHRRSKFLHTMTQRQTFGRKGAVADVAALKREMAKPDGHVEFTGQEYGKDFGVLPTNDMAKAQIDLYLDAKAELDAVSYNAQMAGERQGGDLSGIAISRLQNAGAVELEPDYSALTDWEKRVYRQMWARIKQFWTEEKWIRVTDNYDSLRWVGFNAPVTVQEWLEETINDESNPLQKRQQAAAAFQLLMQQQSPILQEIADVKNAPAEMDVDIILDVTPDVINSQTEQFALLTQFAQASQNIDIVDLIELSQLRNKKELIDKINQRREEASGSMQNQAVAQVQQQASQAIEQLKNQLLEAKLQAVETKAAGQVELQKAEIDRQTRLDEKELEVAGEVATAKITAQGEAATARNEALQAMMEMHSNKVADAINAIREEVRAAATAEPAEQFEPIIPQITVPVNVVVERGGGSKTATMKKLGDGSYSMEIAEAA